MKRKDIQFKDRKLHDKIAISIFAALELATFLEGWKMARATTRYLWGSSRSLGRTLINIAGGAVSVNLVDKCVCEPVYKFNKLILRMDEDIKDDEFLDDPEDDELVTDDIVEKLREEVENGES